MSAVRRVQNRTPVKKSNTGLVIGIVVALIVVGLITAAVLIYFLWWKKRGTTSSTTTTGTTTTTGKCKSGADCPSGKVCNLSDNTCVQCTQDAQCSGTTPVCHNNTCVAGCLSDADCSGVNPRCLVAAKTCVACVSNGDCPSGQQCNGSTNTCVGCIQNADCPSGQVCSSGVCCDQRAPAAFSITATSTDADSDVTTSFVMFQSPGDATVRMNLYNDDGTLIARSNYLVSTGSNTFSQSDFPANTIMFGTVSYKATLNLSGTCGSTPWTSAETAMVPFTMPSCTTTFTPSPQSITGNSGTRQIGLVLSTGTQTIGIAVSDVNGFLPNEGKWNFYGQTGVSAYSGTTYTITIPPGPTISPNSNLYVIYWVELNSGSCIANPSGLFQVTML